MKENPSARQRLAVQEAKVYGWLGLEEPRGELLHVHHSAGLDPIDVDSNRCVFVGPDQPLVLGVSEGFLLNQEKASPDDVQMVRTSRALQDVDGALFHLRGHRESGQQLAPGGGLENVDRLGKNGCNGKHHPSGHARPAGSAEHQHGQPQGQAHALYNSPCLEAGLEGRQSEVRCSQYESGSQAKAGPEKAGRAPSDQQAAQHHVDEEEGANCHCLPEPARVHGVGAAIAEEEPGRPSERMDQ